MKLVFGWRRKISWEIWWKNIFRICHHFKSIGFDDILSGIQPIVVAEMNEAFTCEFRAEEVQQALKQMAPLTAPGLDAMLPIFYKSFWHVVGEDVTPTVLHALNTGTVHESLFLARSG